MSKEDTAKAIGKIITSEYGRDAIHVAVAPMEAAHQLFPGQHVGVVGPGKAGICQTTVGIVDPFLRGPVEPGQQFFLCLYPGTITSLRHEWVHPAFGDAVPEPTKPDKAASEKWLREYAAKVNHYLGADAAYEHLMGDIRNKAITYQGTDMHDLAELIDADLLRHHAQIVLGIPINWHEFEYFSCTC